MFKLAVTYPIHGSRDEVIGSRTHVFDNTYQTPGIPAWLAHKYTEESFGDEPYFLVDAASHRPVCKPVPQVDIGGEDIPF